QELGPSLLIAPKPFSALRQSPVKRKLSTTKQKKAAEMVSQSKEQSDPSSDYPQKKVKFLDAELSSSSSNEYVDSNPSSGRSSLGSIDLKYIDHLVGPGTTSSKLYTSSRLIVNNTNISKELMSARRKAILKQSEITDVSDLFRLVTFFAWTKPPSSSVGSSFIYQSDPATSISKLYSWDYLDGPGRVDSNVDTPCVYNEIALSAALMKFRRRIIGNNGGYTEAHEKLLEENKMWEFEKMLEKSSPKDQNLKAILRNTANNSKYWNMLRENENTYLKDQLGPFLDVYFGKLRYVNNQWTPTQDDTRDQEMSTLIPGYGASTMIGGRRYLVLLLEGKIAGNTGQYQMWDDLTKIGQELKSALDSMLKLMPCGEVCAVGVLVREPLVEFFTMRIHGEGIYVMHKLSSTFIPTGASNGFPILRVMEVCEYTKTVIEQTINQIRSVKDEESVSPKVPMSWLRPSFRKPKRFQV
ncbi:hypothetical protein BGX27_004516, partial [Mortierella sp. AM989]